MQHHCCKVCAVLCCAMPYCHAATAQSNSRMAYEAGARTLLHELLHHLGLYHTFGRNGLGCDDDDGVGDTPKVAGGWPHCGAVRRWVASPRARDGTGGDRTGGEGP